MPKPKYIGGSKHEARVKYFNSAPELRQWISDMSEAYNIPRNLIAYRLGDEGFVDDLIKQNNGVYGEPIHRDLSTIGEFDVHPFTKLGMDNSFNELKDPFYNNFRKIPYVKNANTNEENKYVQTAITTNPLDQLELFARLLHHHYNYTKNKGYKGNDLIRAANRSYNAGKYSTLPLDRYTIDDIYNTIQYPAPRDYKLTYSDSNENLQKMFNKFDESGVTNNYNGTVTVSDRTDVKSKPFMKQYKDEKVSTNVNKVKRNYTLNAVPFIDTPFDKHTKVALKKMTNDFIINNFTNFNKKQFYQDRYINNTNGLVNLLEDNNPNSSIRGPYQHIFKFGGIKQNMKRTKANYGIQRGGYGIPLDTNIYLLHGRSHKNGGIDIGRHVEAQGGEVVRQFDKAGNNLQILSKENNFPYGSPAMNYLTGRMNFDQALNYQQSVNAMLGRGDFAKAKWGWDDIVKGAKKVKDDVSRIVGRNVKEYKDRYAVNRGNGVIGSIANLGNLANTVGSTAADLIEYVDNSTTHNKNSNTGDPMAPMIAPYNYLVNALPVSDRTKKTLAVAPMIVTGKKGGKGKQLSLDFNRTVPLNEVHPKGLHINDKIHGTQQYNKQPNISAPKTPKTVKLKNGKEIILKDENGNIVYEDYRTNDNSNSINTISGNTELPPFLNLLIKDAKTATMNPTVQKFKPRLPYQFQLPEPNITELGKAISRDKHLARYVFDNNRQLFDRLIAELPENDVYNIVGNNIDMFEHTTKNMSGATRIPSDRTIKARITKDTKAAAERAAARAEQRRVVGNINYSLLDALETRRNQPIKEYSNERYIKDKKKGTVTFRGWSKPGEPYQTIDSKIYRRGEGGRKWIDFEGKEHTTIDEPAFDPNNEYNHNFNMWYTRSAKPWRTNRKYTPWDFKNNKPKATPTRSNETAPNSNSNTTQPTPAETPENTSAWKNWWNEHPKLKTASQIGSGALGALGTYMLGDAIFNSAKGTKRDDKHKKAYGGVTPITNLTSRRSNITKQILEELNQYDNMKSHYKKNNKTIPILNLPGLTMQYSKYTPKLEFVPKAPKQQKYKDDDYPYDAPKVIIRDKEHGAKFYKYGGIDTEYDRISRINHNASLRAGKHRQRAVWGDDIKLDDISEKLIKEFTNPNYNINTGTNDDYSYAGTPDYNINTKNNITKNDELSYAARARMGGQGQEVYGSHKPHNISFKNWWNNKFTPWWNNNSEYIPYAINGIGNAIASGLNYGITRNYLNKIKPLEYTPNINVNLPDFDEKANEVKLNSPKYLALQKFASGYDIGGKKQILNREKSRAINSIVRNSSSSNDFKNRTGAIRDAYSDKLLELLSEQANQNRKIGNENIARNIDIMKTNVAQRNEYNKMLAELKNRAIDRKLNYDLAKANFDFNKQSYIDKINYDVAKFNDQRNYNNIMANMTNTNNFVSNLNRSLSGLIDGINEINANNADRAMALLRSDNFAKLDDETKKKLLKKAFGNRFYNELGLG